MDQDGRWAEYKAGITLEEIKAALARVDANPRQSYLGPNTARVYIDWLIEEVERLQSERRSGA